MSHRLLLHAVSPTALPFKAEGAVCIADCACGNRTISVGEGAGVNARTAWAEHMLAAYGLAEQ